MVKNSYDVWKTATADARPGQLYKFLVKQADDKEVMKFDPVALEYEPRLGHAAVISDLPIKHWTDGAWFGWQSGQITLPGQSITTRFTSIPGSSMKPVVFIP